MSFRDDAAAVSEWAARYLERVGDYPARPGGARGDPRCAPAGPPERPEPFSAVLKSRRDSSSGSHTGTCGTSPTSGSRRRSRRSRRAARSCIEPGRVPVANVAGVDGARAARTRGSRSCLACRRAGTGTSRIRPPPRRSRLSWSQGTSPGAAPSCAPSTATRRSRRQPSSSTSSAGRSQPTQSSECGPTCSRVSSSAAMSRPS